MSSHKNSQVFYNNYLQNIYSQKLLNQDEERQYRDYLVKNFRTVLPSKEAHILDIGVGNGRTLLAFKSLGYVHCFGIDIAKDLVEEAKKKGLACEYIENTNAFLHANKEKYSFIYLSHVIEHIPGSEIVEFLSSIKNALTEDGVLVIVTPSVQNIFSIGSFYDFTHVNFFTERSLHQVCEVSGFKNITLVSEKHPMNVYGKGAISFLRFFVSDVIIRISRCIVNAFIRTTRFFIGAINPKILSFNLICICKKADI